MWGDMSLWNVQGPLLHSGDHIVPRILTVDYTFKHEHLVNIGDVFATFLHRYIANGIIFVNQEISPKTKKWWLA